MIDHLAVIIPAANEAKRIQGCLTAVAASAEHAAACLDDPPDVRVVVVLDRCTDATEAIAAAHPGAQTVSRTGGGGVGGARRQGCDHAIASTDGPLTALWIASTDADSRVPLDWITAMATFARAGAQLVLGTVLPDGLDAGVFGKWKARHRLVDGHGYIHGANLGIRGDTYTDLGGWPELASGEDAELVRRARLVDDLTVLSTSAIPVLTSARLRGRVPHGFAGYLRALSVEIPDPA